MELTALLEHLRRVLIDEDTDASTLDRDALAAASGDASVAALAALDEEGEVREALLDSLASRGTAGLSAAQLCAFVQSEDEAREQAIDDALAAGDGLAIRVMNALARTGGLWSHDAISARLVDSEAVSAAACVLAESEPEVLDEWLDEDAEQVEPAVLIEVLRAQLLRGGEDNVEALIDLVESFREEDAGAAKRFVSRLESLVASASPLHFARGFLQGSLEHGWLRDRSAVADFLVLYGETTWVETLAMLEVGESAMAFEFASMIAICASAGLLEVDPDYAPALLDLLQDARNPKGSWEPTAVKHGFQLALALGDEDLAPLLVEAAVHDRLCWNDLPSIGILGLPLSGNDESSLDIEAATKLLEEAIEEEKPDDDVVVSIVRTLCDLRRLHQTEVEAIGPLVEDPENILPRLCDHNNASVNLAARRLLSQLRPISPLEVPPPTSTREAVIAGLDVPGAPELLAELAAGDSVAALWAAAELTELPLEDAFPLLAKAWTSCAPVRGVYLRTVIRDLLEQDTFTYL